MKYIWIVASCAAAIVALVVRGGFAGGGWPVAVAAGAVVFAAVVALNVAGRREEDTEPELRAPFVRRPVEARADDLSPPTEP
jgi:hypothetical protein